MGALGYAWYVPDEEKHLRSKKELEERVITALAGRAAEEIVFDKDSITTGAANDIEQATGSVRAMVTQYGMSERFGLVQIESVEDQYLNGRTVMNCSDHTAAIYFFTVSGFGRKQREVTTCLLREDRPQT